MSEPVAPPPPSPEPGPDSAPDSRADSRADAAASGYGAIRAASVALAAPLSAEDCALQSMPDASPVKWHLAHTSWFFETFVLRPASPSYRPYDARYEQLFNSYYQSLGEPFPRPQRGLLSRPSLDQVLAYRRHVDAAMQLLLARGAAPEIAPLIELGLQHEQQHQELILTDVKHLFSRNPLGPAYRAASPALHAEGLAAAPPTFHWHEHPGGIQRIGAPPAGFAFDNERPRHRRLLEPFALASRLVTNREWLAFIEDRGYTRPELWLSDGFAAVQAEGWWAPLYWERRDGALLELTLHGLGPLAEDAPVCHVSYYEADAFARWSGARLPGEDEWEVIATARDSTRPAQLFGEVWQWTRSPYSPYPGYAPPAGALGEYNGKFMCGQMVLRGSSCATPASHARVSYRNFFPPPARWQWSGLRLAKDLA